MHKLALVLLLAMPGTIVAQNFSQTRGREPVISIHGPWRFHKGDNPAWASPNFDDSQWAQIDYSRLDYSGLPTGSRWYRATFQVPADFEGQELALGMAPLEEVYDVYVEGVLVGRYGSWEPTPRGPFPRHIAFPLPAGLLKGPVGHIAIRQWRGASGLFWQTFTSAGTFSFWHPPQIGLKAAIEPQEQLHLMAGAVRSLPWDLAAVLLLFAATISFVLFSVQQRKAEYLYLGIYCFLLGAPFLLAIPLVENESVMARSWGMVLIFASPRFANAFSLLFLAALCPRIRRILQFGAVILGSFAIVAGYSFAVQQSNIQALLHGGDWCLTLFALIAAGALLLDRSFGSFAIAFCLLLNGAVWFLNFPVFAGPFRIEVPSLPPVLFVFVTLLVLYLRYRDEQIRHAVIDEDLAAARRMQEQLLAGSARNPPGFAVDAVYRPAREVGGDFYRTVGLDDGSLLVLVGDVSGKGLDAAMLVAVILGSLANETHRSPASLLAYLNRAVMGRTAGGFITACCARFYPDGRVAMANAGHISPYLDGRELQLENGLPLGIGAEAVYTETQIATGAAVTFVSDGVVEARDAKGELLGFDRMAALSSQPAGAIAQAAQNWGQQDDITVLTVARSPLLEAIPA
ncbi:MAG: SpoIIE family protein phosphatase [Acidobacteriaceae bacterium]